MSVAGTRAAAVAERATVADGVLQGAAETSDPIMARNRDRSLLEEHKYCGLRLCSVCSDSRMKSYYVETVGCDNGQRARFAHQAALLVSA
jgi:hypothetical protein